jgi:hypothetical protein
MEEDHKTKEASDEGVEKHSCQIELRGAHHVRIEEEHIRIYHLIIYVYDHIYIHIYTYIYAHTHTHILLNTLSIY